MPSPRASWADSTGRFGRSVKWLIAIPVLILAATLWLLARAVSRLRRQLGEAESRLARRFYTLQGRVTEIDVTVRELDFEQRRRRGEIRFDASMKVDEAVAIHPKVREIFAAFGITGGGCAGGGVDETQTIAAASRQAALDPADVLEALARFVENPSAPIEARTATAKLYHIGKTVLS